MSELGVGGAGLIVAYSGATGDPLEIASGSAGESMVMCAPR
jgi:hypothetical protein